MADGLSRALLVAAVVAGIALRCDGLARRPLWYDEAATVLHLGGRSEAACADWYDGRALGRADVLGSPAALPAVVAAARADEPQTGAAYFALAAVWRRSVGGSVAALRALSVVASVLALAATALLAHRLFGDADRALAVAAVVALSPLHLRYAQEARPYALWTLALVAWMHATLGAARRDGWWAWGVQMGAFVVALSVHPLTLLALPAVVALAPRGRTLVASGIGVSVWAILSLTAWGNAAEMGRRTAWVGRSPGGVDLGRAWLGELTSVFFRPGGEGGLLGDPTTLAGRVAWVVLGLAAATLVAAALRGLASAPERARRAVRLLVVVPWAVLAVLDLAIGGRRSTVARYLVPGWLGSELAVGWRLGATRRGRVLLLAVLALAAATAIRTRQRDVWWDTDPPRMRTLAAIADAVRARSDAIVLSDAPPTAVVELAAGLDDDGVTLRLGPSGPAAIGAAEWERVVVAAASPALVEAVRAAAGPTRVLAPITGAPDAWCVGATAP